MYWKDNHGNIYGPFNKQEDGFPNAGEVIRHYRKRGGSSQTAFALILEVQRQQVINMENHNQVPQNLSRRRAIADLLKIPPVLLGIGVLGSYLDPLESHDITPAIHYSVQEAEEYIHTAWEVNFHTSAAHIIPGVKKWEARLEEQVASRSHEYKNSLRLLHQYKHFLLVAGRERQDHSLADPLRLIDAARSLDDPDALGISLFRRGKMYFEQQKYREALCDIREALSLTERTSPKIGGFIQVGSGPVLAHHALDQRDGDEVLALLDEAEKKLSKAKGAPDPFHTGFDENYYYRIRASSITSLLRLDQTQTEKIFEALDLAQSYVEPHQIRRKIGTEFHYANAAFHTGDYLSAASTALETLEIAQSVHLVHVIKHIQGLYEKLTQTKVKDSSELRELRTALMRK